MTPKKYQSGETNVTGRILKIGDAGVRTALYEAANAILERPINGDGGSSGHSVWPSGRGCARPRWRWRELAVVLHRMLVDGTPFDMEKTLAVP